MFHIDRIKSAAELDCLAPKWQALWRRIPNATPFQSPEWLLPWWDCFGTTASLIAAYDTGRLLGILPLYLREEPETRKLLPFGVGLSDYLDALIDPSYPWLAEGMLEKLVTVPGWDECHLPDLPPGAALLTAVCPRMLSEHRSNGATCPVLFLPRSVEGLHQIIPHKTSRYLRRARQRAASVGVVTVRRADADTLTADMNELFRLHARRWERLDEQGVCGDPIVRIFHLRAARQLHGIGLLRLYLLWIAGRAVAAYYGFMAKRAAYAYITGFDPDWAELRPGAQIISYAIEEAIREGAREFHFLRGGEAYKYTWGAVDRPNTARSLRRLC